jgi:UDP-N-acetylmuramoyl-L-alanyl-D-glutamate--2,6-diaminopimelate ligase
MKLRLLLDDLAQKTVVGNPDNVNITGIVYDPLRVESGYLYVAINIYTQLDKIELPDGHPFVGETIRSGAVAVVLQQDLEVPGNIVKIVVPDTRYALSVLANRFYNFPSRNLRLIGVTGTNGKTTTTHIIESIFAQKYKFGLIGTLYYKIDGEIHKSKDTTPEAPELHHIFREMIDHGCTSCVLEASSHGIDFHRLHGLAFDVGVFTNLSQDHLDYHKTMENYLNTKLRFFKWLDKTKYAIINVDDPYSQYFRKATQARVLTYGIHNTADVSAKDIWYTTDGTAYKLITPIGMVEIRSRLLGQFNLSNTLAAVSVAISQEFDLETIKTGIEAPIRVSGRFEPVDKGQDFSVIVDYAHTPSSMENVLKLTKSLNPNRVITIFGCGGDRDPGKRPLMGEVASKYSDVLIITSDNPRNEDPGQIIDQIVKGVDHSSYRTIVDRTEAIREGIQIAQKGDIVMILGKGHETTQTIKGKTKPFDDRIEAEKALVLRESVSAAS